MQTQQKKIEEVFNEGEKARAMNGKHTHNNVVAKNNERGGKSEGESGAKGLSTTRGPKPADQKLVIKSSYFKDVGKYTQKKEPTILSFHTLDSKSSQKSTSNNKNNKSTNNDEEDEMLMMSLFDDYIPPSNKSNNNKKENNNITQEDESAFITGLFDDYEPPTNDNKKEEGEEEEADMNKLFGWDDEETVAQSSSVQSGKKIEEVEVPYPFFKHLEVEEEEDEDEVMEDKVEEKEAEKTKESAGEETKEEKGEEKIEEKEKEKEVIRKKSRANRRDLFLCKVLEPVKYTPTKDPEDGNILVSITGMREYSDISFEELHLFSTQSTNCSIQTPKLAQGSDMWNWGWSKFGQLGSGFSKNVRCAFPTYTSFPSSNEDEVIEQNIVQISSGAVHSICLNENGSVASWGRGKGGRLGHPDNQAKQIPTIIDAFTNIRIKFVACGTAHSAFVSDEGQLWTVGSGGHGQLGNGKFATTNVPHKVEELMWNKVAYVSCGKQNTAAITVRGQLYTWGANSNGQLGYKLPQGTKNSAVPRQVPELDFEVICQVAVGGKHMAAISKDGCIWTWGGNDYSQLGTQGWDGCVPTKLSWTGWNKLGRALMVACGESHTAAILLKNSKGVEGEVGKKEETIVMTWGRGDLGALGNGKLQISSATPCIVKELSGKKIVQIACGANHTAALTVRGRLWIWGENSKDQASGKEEICLSPTIVDSLLHVTQVSCGGSHTSVLVTGKRELVMQHSKDGNYEQVENLVTLDPSLVRRIDPRTGYTPLHWACRMGHASIAALLVEHGADPNSRTPFSRDSFPHLLSPLHICAAFPKGVPCIDVLTALPNIQLNLVDSKGETALHRAVAYNNEEAVYAFVRAGCDKRAVDPNGSTPLHFATKCKYSHIARFLVRNAAPITVHDSFGKTPLYYNNNDRINQELKKIAQSHDVFISYAHSDMAFARKVRMELERNCIKCWMDDQRLEAGSDWRADIGNGILAARLIVFLASPTSIVSDWCLKELKMGEKNSKFIWPVWYQKSEVPTSVSVLFSSSKFADLSTDELYQSGMPNLVRRLKITIEKLDRFEFIEKAQPRSTQNFAEISGKPFSYLSYLPADHSVVSNFKFLLSKNGVIWADEETVGQHEIEQAELAEAEKAEGENMIDVNQSFWQEEKKKEDELAGKIEEVAAEGNEGIKLCSAFILVMSQQVIDSKDRQIRKHIKYAQENHKPIVLILKDLPQSFKFAPEDPYFGILGKVPTFHFTTAELKYLALRDESMENLKRVVYVVELLYKETLLADKLKKMELEKEKQLAEAQRLAAEEAKKKKKFARV